MPNVSKEQAAALLARMSEETAGKRGTADKTHRCIAWLERVEDIALLQEILDCEGMPIAQVGKRAVKQVLRDYLNSLK